MRFSCGEKWGHYKDRMEQWHRKFAWLPVTVEDDNSDAHHECVWLEWVWRSGHWWDGWGECGWTWKYRKSLP